MSKFAQEDKHWLMGCTPTKRKLSATEDALVTTTWDTETDHDVANIIKNIAAIKTIKRLCIVKLALFIPEQVMHLLIMGKVSATTHRAMTRLYLSFVRNKISLANFNKSLLNVTKDSIII